MILQAARYVSPNMGYTQSVYFCLALPVLLTVSVLCDTIFPPTIPQTFYPGMFVQPSSPFPEAAHNFLKMQHLQRKMEEQHYATKAHFARKQMSTTPIWPPFGHPVKPPFTPMSNIHIPMLPMNFVGFHQFPSNKQLYARQLAPMTPVGNLVGKHIQKHVAQKVVMEQQIQDEEFIKKHKMTTHPYGYWSNPIPDNSEEATPHYIGFVDLANQIRVGPPNQRKAVDGVDVVFHGPILPPDVAINPTDPIHNLPMNHLFVPIPIQNKFATTTMTPLPPPVFADILIVIDTSSAMGQIAPDGTVIWNQHVVDFLLKLINLTPMGPKLNRIGVVVVSEGIDDMIPLSPDKEFLLHTLKKIRPTFKGGCTKAGIRTASSLFYQYGRQMAVKRIVLLTEGPSKCPYRSMEEIQFARKCGIDILHVGFGAGTTPYPHTDKLYGQSMWMVPDANRLGTIVEPVYERAGKEPVHGGWSMWSEWNACSASGTCNMGYQMRFRLCDNPSPMFGGRICEGYPAETRMCHMGPCHDMSVGQWTRWSHFGPCSSPCGIGSQSRARSCVTLDGNPSGTCVGLYVEVRECSEKKCPQQGGWSEWSEWGWCSATCGTGIRMRARQCDTPSLENGGMLCPGMPVEETLCDSLIPCPVDGGFSEWTEWSVCDEPCGVGMKQRKRFCNNPEPQEGGKDCVGDFHMTTTCDTEVPCPVHGGWTEWGHVSDCSVSCGVGIMFRERFCANPHPKFGGDFCLGPNREELECTTGKLCPIHGGWSMWSEFSLCSVSCGIGVKMRKRVCDSPATMYGGDDCFGMSVEEEMCDTEIYCPINGGWSLWSDFSQCSVKCGVGIMQRFRECTEPLPKIGGSKCVGMSVEGKKCDTGIKCPVDGFWSLWSPWGYCSASCGVGFRQRERLCNNPMPNFGGLSCHGSPIEEDLCDTGIPCPVNGGWSSWSDPLPCSAKCGIGTTRRVRMCNNPFPNHGGDDCDGPDVDEYDCDTGIPCSIDGGWTIWSTWGACSAKCGMGVQQRLRSCDNPKPMFGGMVCKGLEIDERPCEIDIPCPIDGFWSFWSEWDMCSSDCGIGFTTRRRFCNNPEPRFGGQLCIGNHVEKIECGSGIPCPIDGGWSTWSPLSPCSVTCGVGVMKRHRECSNPVPMNGGMSCQGYAVEETLCDTTSACPIHGEWGFWSKWSGCSSDCGKGYMYRIRECDAPFPMYGGLPCDGNHKEEQMCDTGINCPVNGNWGPWSEFTPCNVYCGVGIIRRKRECNSPAPMHGGKPCIGFEIDETLCNAGVECPVDGHWSPWSEFSKCSVSCGIGIHRRKRRCNNPPPMFGGGFCPGNPIEESMCDTGSPCPVDGIWSPWSDFSQCSAQCGIGVQQRIRDCSMPEPMHGGLDCFGPRIEQRHCDTKVICAVHGGWAPWTLWTPCSVQCGVGTTFRKRECVNPPPLYGGMSCQGPGVEEKPCDTLIHCRIAGNWGPWGTFGPCPVKCGVGMVQRIRECNNPPPQYGGDDCFGDMIQQQTCDTSIYCPVDGGFSPWSVWSPCSATCDKGIQFRKRLCNSPPPMYGGTDCIGVFSEERQCDAGVYCPVDGSWGSWSPFSQCSAVCGSGTKERTRLCDAPVPKYNGMDCSGFHTDVQSCETGVYCPVNGDWTLWSPWTDCSVSCDVGIQQRFRSCTNPMPQWKGLPCQGEDMQEQVCNSGNHCPIDGNWGFWSDWGPCSASCGKGVYVRIRICDNPPEQFGGAPCMGPLEEKMVCDSGIPCPIDGVWSPWSPWSKCSASCALGVQHRMRGCNNPPPKFAGHTCQGESEQLRDCDTSIPCPLDGNWSHWSKWAPCSATCGIGMHARTRSCTNPPPSYGGLFCAGEKAQTSECDSGTPCPIDGQWSMWSDYGPCSASCGTGMHARLRECNNPVPMYRGQLCLGSNSDDKPCETGIPCPIDGNWTPWSSFGPCDSKCGMGFQERTRACANPAPQFDGLLCQGPEIDRLECDSGIDCPVHGGWSLWSDWGYCSEKCGVGIEKRGRLCNSPLPYFGGFPCQGPLEESRPCDTGVFCPIHGQWTVWSPFSACSHSCGEGMQSRFRICANPSPQHKGDACYGPPEETVPCSSGKPCPIDGNWGPWGKFGQCNVQCGIGMHKRMRECNNPPPQFGGFDCTGPALEEGTCDTHTPCSLDGGWSFWSPWSGCSVSCGMGEEIRLRECTDPFPLNGGTMCSGMDKDIRQCTTGQSCPVDGSWTPWSNWSPCDATCGEGRQERLRQCVAPSPEYGGRPCPGHPSEFRDCHSGVPCPIDGSWTLWTPWSGCSVNCGVGVRKRTRVCDNPPPQFAGNLCDGIDMDVEPCDTRVMCPVHGDWSPWAPWSDCSVPCHVGIQVRERLCDSPIPQNGGLECIGISEEVRDCDTKIECPIHGGWTFWSPWTKCLADCGVGEQKRFRECMNPPPQNGGMPCKGPPEEMIACDTTVPCPIHGNWSPWSGFSPCSAPCEFGTQTRSRSCNDPSPQFGGLPCEGFSVDEIGCDTGIPCPVHGGWGPWIDWIPCSAKCGIGEMSRRRECNNPVPLNGGMPCEGPNIEIGPCDSGMQCPIHGNWGVWSPFSKCSHSCGVGMKTRNRECSSPAPQFDGNPCLGEIHESVECGTGIECPVDGGWGPWGPYGACSVECGMGVYSRTRLCDSPRPQFGGLDCFGPNIEETKCDTRKPCFVHGGWTFWSPWSDCSTSCAMGLQTRVRECTNPSPLHGGYMCQGDEQEMRDCDTSIPCLVNGGWGEWLPWSHCSADCAFGLKERKRECNYPAPQFGGLPCNGPISEVVECDSGIPCPIHGSWTPWSPWSKCSHSCDIGQERRFRTCDSPQPAFGGLPCDGFPEEIRICNSGMLCPINGGWSSWSSFASCSVTCGSGLHERFRDCDNPPPQNGGFDCDGDAFDIRECHTKIPCSTNGGWSLWSSWTACSASCGIGTMMRVRECTNPMPSYGGQPCQGNDKELQDCTSDITCPIHGHWSHWSEWGKCSERCGTGQQFRHRKCDNPHPAFGGNFCHGSDKEMMLCETGIHCTVDGNWGPWSPWDKCDAKCGDGNQMRIRMCIDPKPMYGGKMCHGVHQESRPCNSGVYCPLDGQWSLWQLWSSCDAKCGMGQQTRIRTCTEPSPQFGGLSCQGLPQELRECDSGRYCSIDGAWGTWSQWGLCSVPCGIGEQTRTRLCDSPAPSFGGHVCQGYHTEAIKCDTGVTCWSTWEAWSACSVTCDFGKRYRHRSCKDPNGDKSLCSGPEDDVDDCDSGVPCDGGPTGPRWAPWTSWSKCSTTCGVGIQTRRRDCMTTYPNMPCTGPAEDTFICDTGTTCPIHGGWSNWTPYGECKVDCAKGILATGYKMRRRFCNNPFAQNGGDSCFGVATEEIPCIDYLPCSGAEWTDWSRWSKCSAECGPGTTVRTRNCIYPSNKQPARDCVGVSESVVTCELRSCPLHELNCSAECKWDNGIGYSAYPGDCSKFVQCETLDGQPQVHDCSWGLFWSLEMLQCVWPDQSECDYCTTMKAGEMRPYFISCRSYWQCFNGVARPACCPEGQKFNSLTNKCETDVDGICSMPCPPKKHEPSLAETKTMIDVSCMFRLSPLGSAWYEQDIAGTWVSRPCSQGTVFSEEYCQCIYSAEGTLGIVRECLPDLHLTFDTKEADIARNSGLHVENVTYRGDGTAYFNGNAAINSNIFANSEWGRNVYVYIRFKPEGTGRDQGLVHNSGCGPSDIGPSVFMAIDRVDNGNNMLNMKFAAVPKWKPLTYEFINVTVPDNRMIDAWFKFTDGKFTADVDGQVVTIDIHAKEVARRHGAINIAGNLCKIGDQSFGGFEGYIDEVKIYKCKPSKMK